MKSPTLAIRKGVYDALSPLEIDSVVIPIFDSVVNPEVTIPTFMGGKAYIILSSQSNNETTDNKCDFRQNANITIDIFVKFNKGYGGQFASDLISNSIQYVIQPFEGIGIDVSPHFQILKTTKIVDLQFAEHTPTQSVYRVELIYAFDTFQK